MVDKLPRVVTTCTSRCHGLQNPPWLRRSVLKTISGRLPSAMPPQQPHFGTRSAQGFLERAAVALRDATPSVVREDLSGAEAAGRQGGRVNWLSYRCVPSISSDWRRTDPHVAKPGQDV